MKVSEVYTNNAGQQFEIVAIVGKKALVRFLETSSTRLAYRENITAGKVKDLYSKSTNGVGYLGEFEKNQYWKQAMQLWRNMMKRCYTDDPKGYKYKGTTVDAHWHCFANFHRDLPKLKNFSNWLAFYEGKSKVQYNLDKDLQVGSNNIYSPNTCGFELESVNKAAGKGGKRLVDGSWVTSKA
jgi:hypothetical protein